MLNSLLTVRKNSNNLSGRLLLSFCLLFNSVISLSQNLVVNGSFENAACPVPPTGTGQLTLATGWENACSSGSTYPDLFSSCFNNSLAGGSCLRVSVPVNFAASNCPAKNGNNYAGLICYRSNNMLREYITTKLSSTLTPGKVYHIGFYAKKAPGCRYATAGLAALLSPGKPLQSGNGLINQNPQIVCSGTLTDTINWTLIKGYFVPQSNLDYLTLGNFNSDAQSSVTDLGSSSGTVCLDRNSYYFIDEVSVEEVAENLEIIGDSVVCIGELTTLTASSTHPFWWSTAGNPTDTFSLQQSITVDPATESNYILNGFIQKKAISIDIIAPPTANLIQDTTICEGEIINIHAGNVNCSYVWSTNEKEEFITTGNEGIYWVNVSNEGCSITDTINVYVTNVPEINLGSDSVFCFADYDSLILDAGEGITYLWRPTGETIRYKTVTASGIYSVTVQHATGCVSSDSVTAIEICKPKIFIPKAFSPNNDLLNDSFQPFSSGILSFEMKILNRWGQLVFLGTDKAWDGKFRQKNAPAGVYVYQITCYLINETGKRVGLTQNGWVALVE